MMSGQGTGLCKLLVAGAVWIWERVLRSPGFGSEAACASVRRRLVRATSLSWPRNLPMSAIDDFTSVRVQDLAGHIGRIVGGQEHISRGDLQRFTGPAQRDVRTKLPHLGLVESGRDERCPNGTRRHRVHPELPRCQR